MACGKVLTFILLSLAAEHCHAGCEDSWGDDHYACSECIGGEHDWAAVDQCTACTEDYKLEDADGDGYGECEYDFDGWDDGTTSTCTWRDDMAEDWYGKILVGCIIGIVITLVTTVVTSLPVCCGVMKDGPVKIIAIVCGAIAAVSYAIPFIAGAATAGSFTDDICDSCGGCNDKDRKDLEESIGALGILVAYIHGFGFVVVVLASITLCLSCCMCCPCCGPLKKQKDTVEVVQGQPQAQVVGAVVQPAKAS